MSLKPIDERKDIDTRQTLWEEIRRLKIFKADDLRHVSRMKKSSIHTYLIGLFNAGYLTRKKEDRPNQLTSPYIYTLVNDPGVFAPRVRKNGTEVTQGRGRYLLWSTMRILKTFTAQELAITATIEEHNIALGEAETYCYALAKAGYIKVIAGGKSGQPATYRMIKYTGPRPPQIQRVKRLYDPNISKVVWDNKEGRHDQK